MPKNESEGKKILRQAENARLNEQEVQQRRLILSSLPRYVTIGSHFACNARCIFCLGGDYPPFSMKTYREFFEPRLGDVLACADHVGFCGYGETLLMPDIIEFLDYINGKLPHTRKIFTTNGSPLTDGVIGKLSEGLNAVIISLHAADAGLHRRLTGLKNYEFILKAVRKMTDFKKRTGRDLHTNLVFLLTRMNVDNLPDFVRLGADLGVDRLTCNYITIFNEEQVEMSCFLEKEKTLDRMEEAEKLAAELGVTLVLPPKFGKQAGRSSVCQDPWNFCYIETQGSVLPCCSAGDHIGYLDKEEFSRIWNGYGYVRLRKGLSAKTPFFWCEDCCKYDPNNVNKFISHVTFRPETRKKLLAFYERHSAKKN